MSAKKLLPSIRKKEAERAEREAVIKYFPPSEFDEAGVDMFESFIDNYVNDPNSQEQIDDLRAAIDNLSSDNAERQSLKKQAFKYLSFAKIITSSKFILCDDLIIRIINE